MFPEVDVVINDDTELYRQFTKNRDFRRWMTDAVFELASNQVGAARRAAIRNHPASNAHDRGATHTPPGM